VGDCYHVVVDRFASVTRRILLRPAVVPAPGVPRTPVRNAALCNGNAMKPTCLACVTVAVAEPASRRRSSAVCRGPATVAGTLVGATENALP